VIQGSVDMYIYVEICLKQSPGMKITSKIIFPKKGKYSSQCSYGVLILKRGAANIPRRLICLMWTILARIKDGQTKDSFMLIASRIRLTAILACISWPQERNQNIWVSVQYVIGIWFPKRIWKDSMRNTQFPLIDSPTVVDLTSGSWSTLPQGISQQC